MYLASGSPEARCLGVVTGVVPRWRACGGCVLIRLLVLLVAVAMVVV